MKICFLFILILLINFGFAIEINNIDCPKEVNINEEFYCVLDLIEVNGLYDLKLNVNSKELSNLNKVWNGNIWQRSDWYLQSLISKDGEYKILSKVDKEYEGIAFISLRLRENKASSFNEEVLEIKINQEEKIENDNIEEISNKYETFEQLNTEENEIKNENKIISKSIINLNSNDNIEELIYESKSKKILRIIPYILGIFLIGLISFIIIKK
ncbi:MAG: hypothetical protein PHH53_00615 [Candidatus Nanoarchaeia archaeon]|nr:hypothetical protein [Candidatus Nanoarchaeia archaeon]